MANFILSTMWLIGTIVMEIVMLAATTVISILSAVFAVLSFVTGLICDALQKLINGISLFQNSLLERFNSETTIKEELESGVVVKED
jgi:hypothetical protein